MGPREFVRMDQEERLARVGVLCTGPTRLLRPPLLDATETKCGFPRTYQHGVAATLGFSPRGVDSSGASDVPLLVPYRTLARLAFAWLFCYASVLCLRTQALFTARFNHNQ